MNNSKNEDGYVLVVIIGILTILSLMAVTFATLSRIETRAARNYTDSVKCEMVAKAGLEHALYVLRLDKFGIDTIAYNNDYGDENYDWSGETWMPGNVAPTDAITSFAGTNTSHYDNDGDSIPDSKWIYFPVTTASGTSATAIRLPGNLLARYAVLITDDREARININVTGNKAGVGNAHTSNEGWSTFEDDLSFTIEQATGNSGLADTIASDIINERFGTDTTPGTVLVNDNSGIVPNPQTDDIDNDGDGVIDELDEATDEPVEFNSIFPYVNDVPFGLLSETEIMGTSSYTSRLETIFNNRGVSVTDQNSINGWLTTYSADTIVCPPYTLGTSTATTKLNINTLVNNEGAYASLLTYDSDKKVEMIVDVLVAGGLTGPLGSSNYIERHQLAVNIKDFIDPDSTVTKYNDGANIYYGVEKTPYINEVEAEVDSTATKSSGSPTGKGKFIELFNPYDTSIPIEGWTITWGTTPIQTVTIDGPGTSTATIAQHDYYTIADDQSAYTRDNTTHPKGFSYEGGAAADQIDIGVNNLLTGDSVLTLKDNIGNIVQVTEYGRADATTNTRQLNDPRPIPLTSSGSNPWYWNTDSQTAGGTNATLDFTGTGVDGWNFTTWSSSFIVKNRRFSNKGHIGFIHRGSKWSSFKVDNTIAHPDVLKYFTITDPSMDNIDNDGDGAIDASDTGPQTGDFDGREYRIPGLINVNTAPKEVLLSLPNITSAIADDIILTRSTEFRSIGDFVDRVNQITGTTGIKWDKEKTFRSISNLITTRSNVFTVYITAQITDETASNVFAEKRALAIVDRSVEPIKVRYFRWITE